MGHLLLDKTSMLLLWSWQETKGGVYIINTTQLDESNKEDLNSATAMAWILPTSTWVWKGVLDCRKELRQAYNLHKPLWDLDQSTS